MGEWKRSKLGDIIFFGNGNASPKEDGDIPVYGGNGILGYANKSNYDGETVIIGRAGAYAGAVGALQMLAAERTSDYEARFANPFVLTLLYLSSIVTLQP